MTRWRGLFFDLFDTVVRFDLERLPWTQVGDSRRRSTLGPVHAVLTEVWPGVDLADFRIALKSVQDEIVAERDAEWVEVSCDRRFARTLARLGLPDGGLATALADCHMTLLLGAVVLPPEHRDLLKSLQGRYSMALVSNFDSGRHGRRLLRDLELLGLFPQVVLSDEVGRRKPHASLFRVPAQALGLDPADVLFVGDTPATDVHGAHTSGMDTAWVSWGRHPFPAGPVHPTLTLHTLVDLVPALGALLP